jgi:16S rRNA (guanine527-N7)-methyltransferase
VALTYSAYMVAEGGSAIYKDLALDWGMPLSKEAQEGLAVYAGKLLEWNRAVNLTGARSLEALVWEQFPDSFALAKLSQPNANVVDVGSGGGLPAIPFAILRPDCRVTLVEPRAKRTAFLNMVVRSCRCSLVRVFRGRAEDVESGAYSLASSKATFTPSVWMEVAQRLVSADGRIVVFCTTEPSDVAPRLRLAEGFSYPSMTGVARWCGAYCFT